MKQARIRRMEPEFAAKMMERWRAHKASGALKRFWNRTAPEGAPFNEAEAVALALTLLDCYQGALRKIAEKGGGDAALAREALAYRPAVWS